jgi:hypothetical protein
MAGLRQGQAHDEYVRRESMQCGASPCLLSALLMGVKVQVVVGGQPRGVIQPVIRVVMVCVPVASSYDSTMSQTTPPA